MKSALVLTLAGSALAMPFSNAIDAMFGTNLEKRQMGGPPSFPIPSGGFPGNLPSGGCTGIPHFPGGQRPTGLPGAPAPTGGFPIGGPPNAPAPTGFFPGPFEPGAGTPQVTRSLAIDYALAPRMNKRQSGSLPSFSLLDPSDELPAPTQSGLPLPSGGAPSFPDPSDAPEVPLPTPSPEDPESPFPSNSPDLPGDSPFPIPSGAPFPLPTGGAPFPFPTGGFPGAPQPTGGLPVPPIGTGFPPLPTTLATITRGPRPTSVPSFPGLPGDDEEEDGGSWWDKVKEIFGGGQM